RRGDSLVDVVLERAPEPDRPFEAIAETPIPAATGATVPLKAAGQTQLDHGFAWLSRRNTRRMVEVWADLDGTTRASDVVNRLDDWLRARQWQPGYGFAYAGEEEETMKSFKKLGIAAFGALVLVFLLLLWMFDDFRLSMLVVLAIPFVLIGVLPGLAITGNAFGFMAFLGLIALIGVFVNHKIYFIDRMLELMQRGQDLPTAILHAGLDRLRPVVLTALTAVLGLVPLTLSGARMWGSFGWVNIFGLTVSIPLSLVLLPALVVLVWRRRAARNSNP
ncbi:MAG: efflux RND transporter permease subunit, partial [Pseudomonadota bacterium]